MSTAKSLAGAAVTALIKSDPSALAIAGGKEAVGWLLDRLRASEKGIHARLIEALTADLQPIVAEIESAITNAEVLFEQHGLSAHDLVALDLEPARATEALLRRGEGMLRTAGEPVAGIIRSKIVPKVHARLLADPEQIEALQPAIFQALLRERQAIAGLGDDLGRGLRLMTGAGLVSDPRRRWKAGRKDAAILRAEYRVVDFHPERQAVLDELRAWCEDDAPIAVRLITGQGGAGKTRLALQMLGELPSWRAGFLHRDAGDVLTYALDGLFADPRPLFLVVDYAETRRGLVERILAHLRDAPNRVRVLLLARTAADWWPTLQIANSDLRDLFSEHPPSERTLTRIADEPGNRRTVFEAALADYAKALGASAPSVGLDVSAPHFATTLFLHIAALAALEGAVPEGEQALLDWALKRERGLWLERYHGDAGRAGAFAQAAALLTLTGGAEESEDALEVFGRWPQLRAKGQDALFHMFGLLGQLYPQDGGATGIRPDLLGEHLVDQELSHAPKMLDAALAGEPAPPLTVLTRLAKRKPSARRWLAQAFESNLERLAEPAIRVALETGDPIGPILADALAQRMQANGLLDDEQLQRMENSVPYPTTALCEVGVSVMAQRRAVLLRSSEPLDEDTCAKVARVVGNLATRLADLGRRDESLAAAEETRARFRDLASANPKVFTPEFAKSLNNLANQLSRFGRWEEALVVAEEAVRLRRELAAAQPDAFTPDLAMSLNNFAKFLSDLGRREDALEMIEEAVRLRRELAAARPDAFTPSLANSLNNLAANLADAGRREEALEAAEEAVWLSRELAAARPDAFTPDLAMSLNNLANLLGDFGRREEALQAAEEATGLFHGLAAARPDVFTPNLPILLNNLANRLSDLGRREEALAAAEEAVRLRRTLAAARPDAFTPDLATSLNNLADDLAALGRHDEALATATEAVQTLGPYFLARPLAFAPWMRIMVRVYAKRCKELGRDPDHELLGPIEAALAALDEGGAAESGEADKA